MTWKKETFEVCDKPEEGESVQYIALHILQWGDFCKRFGLSNEEIKFFLREPESTETTENIPGGRK